MIKTAIIYRHYHEFSEKGKCGYVGQTTIQIQERFKEHIYLSTYKSNKGFGAALRKYGSENFKSEILETLNDTTQQEIDKREIFWIEKMNSFPNGYNMTMGGSGRTKWNEDNIILEAKKYIHKKDFWASAKPAASRAKKLGIFDKVTEHMILPQKKSDEEIFEIAKKYKYLGDFTKNELSVYTMAKYRNIFDKATKHMIRYAPGGSWRS